MKIPFNIVLALDTNMGIGKNNQLPWHIREDLRNFAKITTNHAIIMGRKTWDSLPKKPLPNRINIVVSKSKRPDNLNPNVHWINDLTSNNTQTFLLKIIQLNKQIFCIGGAGILKEMLKYKLYCKKLFIHHIQEDYQCDTIFPLNEWIKDYSSNITFQKIVTDKKNNKQVRYSQVIYSQN